MKIKTPKIGSRITGPIERGFPEPDSPKHDRSLERSPNRTQKNSRTRSRTRSRKSKSRSFKN